MSSHEVTQESWDLGRPKSLGGSQMEEVSVDDLRIAYANVGGIGEDKSQKDNKINTWINFIKADIIGMAETNYNWWFRDAVPPNERAKRWCQMPGRRNAQLIIFAHNENDVDARQFQIGGVVLLIRGQTVNRIIEWGKDEKDMGRWA